MQMKGTSSFPCYAMVNVLLSYSESSLQTFSEVGFNLNPMAWSQFGSNKRRQRLLLNLLATPHSLVFMDVFENKFFLKFGG